MLVSEGANLQDRFNRQRGEIRMCLFRRATVLFFDEDQFRLNAGTFDNRPSPHLPGNPLNLLALQPVHIDIVAQNALASPG